MKIKGEFRDVLIKNGNVIEDIGWRSNSIAQEYGQFLAAVMKKEYKDTSVPPKPVGIGIEYLAVGSSNDNAGDFKRRVEEFFKNLNAHPADKDKPFYYPAGTENWVWAKKIEDTRDIEYLISDTDPAPAGTITNYLQINVVFGNNEPNSVKNLKFEDFALLGIYNSGTAINPAFDTHRMYFINHRSHDTITKEPGMVLTRTIKLRFP